MSIEKLKLNSGLITYELAKKINEIIDHMEQGKEVNLFCAVCRERIKPNLEHRCRGRLESTKEVPDIRFKQIGSVIIDYAKKYKNWVNTNAINAEELDKELDYSIQEISKLMPRVEGLSITCDFCHTQLTELGGILISPPDENGMVRKEHLCRNCFKTKPRVVSKREMHKAIADIGLDQDCRETDRIVEAIHKLITKG